MPIACKQNREVFVEKVALALVYLSSKRRRHDRCECLLERR
jgi:hypothetical protein